MIEAGLLLLLVPISRSHLRYVYYTRIFIHIQADFRTFKSLITHTGRTFNAVLWEKKNNRDLEGENSNE